MALIKRLSFLKKSRERLSPSKWLSKLLFKLDAC